MSDERSRCFWCGDDPLYVQYHDEEWGVPTWDETELFERLILEGFQAGLSWRTILYKRANFRRAFDGFDIAKMAAWDEARIAELMQDAGIVRNGMNLHAAARNAGSWLHLRAREGDVSRWLWDFAGGVVLLPTVPMTIETLRAYSPEAVTMSKALQKEGFTFVGPTICYAFMQSVGMVDDHLTGCFKYRGPALGD